MLMGMELDIRFWSKVEKTDTCWLWKAGKTIDNYGRFKLNGKTQRSHRLSFEFHKGKIPDGLQIDHLCKNRLCCNPDHLEAVTCKENINRGLTGYNTKNNVNKKKTHCKRGHEYTPENTYVWRGMRDCRECTRIRYHGRKSFEK